MTTKPDAIPRLENIASRSEPATFASRAEANLVYMGQTLPDALNEHADYAEEVRDDVLATALAGDLPDMTGKAGKLIGVNPAEDAAAFYNPALAQGRLLYSSATELLLLPKRGNLFPLNGGVVELPVAGVSFANTGLAVSSLYYLFLYDNSGTLTIESDTTAPVEDTTAGNIGLWVKSGDTTRTFIGSVYTDASGEFTDGQVGSLGANPIVLREWMDTDNTSYSTGAQTISAGPRFYVHQMHPDSELEVEWFYRVGTSNTQSDNDAGMYTQARFWDGAAYQGIGHLHLHRILGSGSDETSFFHTETQKAVYKSSHTYNNGGIQTWLVNIGYYEVYDATANVNSCRAHFREILR